MKEFKLNNGMSVVFVSSNDNSVCLSINVGHVNEPKIGLAALFEKTLLLQVKGIIPVFGGTMTAYTASGDDYEDALKIASQIFNATVISEAYVEQAKAEIVRSTQSNAQMVMRQMKLLYKHTAFSSNRVVSPEEYLRCINAYTVEDVREFANTYYTARNTVLVVAGRGMDFNAIKVAVNQYFGNVPEGLARQKVKKDIYTGGFGRLDCSGTMVRLMFGFDVTPLTIDDSPVANVMMTMFWRRLDHALADAGIEAQTEVKIAGYYGLRTMRALIVASGADVKKLTEIFVKVVNRICEENASDERMEKSRNWAMAEKLDKYDRTDDKALEVAWQMVGRGRMYDIGARIKDICNVDAEAVRELSCKVFRGSVPTYIVATDPAAEIYSFAVLKQMMKL